MKKIVLDFYSCYNLGDDLFVAVFADYFQSCRILLLTNPKCIPRNLGKNVRVHPFSYPDLLLRKLADLASGCGKDGLAHLLEVCRKKCLHRIAEKCDAFVKIGGSIFMQHAPGCAEIDFSTEEKPEFRQENKSGGFGNRFVIGANLGPVYDADYWTQMKAEFQNYRHICLRDYASYRKMCGEPNVQYAPDVLFLIPAPKTAPKGENVAFSVMDMRQYTDREATVQAYYGLLEQGIAYFLHAKIPVTLVSFCQYQGDEQAIGELLGRFPGEKGISTCCYRGDAAPVLEALAGASFIVGSRFHSTILGISFGKPVFPIVYNSKTSHYLADLSFPGKYALLEDLQAVTVDDLLYNYTHHIVADCADHHRYAVNQFKGLEDYLENKESAIESSII